MQLWMVTILTDSSAADAATTLQALCSPGCSVTLGQQAVGRAMAEVAEEVPTPLSPPPPHPYPSPHLNPIPTSPLPPPPPLESPPFSQPSPPRNLTPHMMQVELRVERELASDDSLTAPLPLSLGPPGSGGIELVSEALEQVESVSSTTC